MTAPRMLSRHLVAGIRSAGAVLAQTPMAARDVEVVHRFASDAAAMDLAEPQTALPCVLRTSRPELCFDLTFRIRFAADVKLREIAGDGNYLKDGPVPGAVAPATGHPWEGPDPLSAPARQPDLTVLLSMAPSSEW
jgi:hypothetical protein